MDKQYRVYKALPVTNRLKVLTSRFSYQFFFFLLKQSLETNQVRTIELHYEANLRKSCGLDRYANMR